MLSIVLPLLALAIALTPVVASARMTYKREMAAQIYESTTSRQVATVAQARPSIVPVKTVV